MQPVERHFFNTKGRHDYKSVAPEEGFDETIWAMFLRATSLVIQVERKQQAPNGGYYYKVSNTRMYKVRTNKNGERYLKVLEKTGTGRIFNQTIDSLRSDTWLYSFGRTAESLDGPVCAEMTRLFEAHLSKMLGFPFKRRFEPKRGLEQWYENEEDWNTTPEGLCYPFMRDASNREFVLPLLKEANKRRAFSYTSLLSENNLTQFLRIEDSGPRSWKHALRESANKDDFVKNMVYRSAVANQEDIQIIADNPALLRLLSFIDLRISTTKAATAGLADLFLNFHTFMNAAELLAFKFMLANFPKKRLGELFDLAKQMQEFRQSQTQKCSGLKLGDLVEKQHIKSYSNKAHGSLSNVNNFFKHVPRGKRQQFSIAFFVCFKNSYLETEENFAEFMESPDSGFMKKWAEKRDEFFVPVCSTFMEVYWKQYLATLPSDSLVRFSATAKELFGVDISELEGSSDVQIETAIVPELDLKLPYISVRQNSYVKPNADLFSFLQQDVDLCGILRSATGHASTYFLWNYGKVTNTSNLMLVSEMEEVLIKTAAKIDERLLKLGQKITPENRMLFIRTHSYSRKYKINWRYYTLGVTDRELYHYKKAGIRSKRDILQWIEYKNTLPKEMYNELLLDAAGLGPSSSDSSSFSFAQPF